MGQAGFVDGNGWVSFTSDDLIERHESNHKSWYASMTENVPDELLEGLITPQEGYQDAFDLYVSYTGGRFFNTGDAAYQGFATNITTGLDYNSGDGLLVGAALGYENAELEFDNSLDGKVNKSGWRIDTYAGYQPDPLLSFEGLISYGWLDNDITANLETGSTKSNRLIASGKASVVIDVQPYTIAPYLAGDYLSETIDAYTTDLGTDVGQVETSAFATSGGIRISTNDSLILGLSSFASYDFKYYWSGTEAETLTSGDTLDPSNFASTVAMGLSGSMNDIFGIGWLNGAEIDLSFQATNPLTLERSYATTGTMRWRF